MDWLRDTGRVVRAAYERTVTGRDDHGSTYYYDAPGDTCLRAMLNEAYTLALHMRQALAHTVGFLAKNKNDHRPCLTCTRAFFVLFRSPVCRTCSKRAPPVCPGLSCAGCAKMNAPAAQK